MRALPHDHVSTAMASTHGYRKLDWLMGRWGKGTCKAVVEMGLTHRDRAMEVTVYYIYCTVQQNVLGA